MMIITFLLNTLYIHIPHITSFLLWRPIDVFHDKLSTLTSDSPEITLRYDQTSSNDSISITYADQVHIFYDGFL